MYHKSPVEKEIKEALWNLLIDKSVLLSNVEVKETPEQKVILYAEQGNGLTLRDADIEIINMIAKPYLDKYFDNKHKMEIVCVGAYL